MPDYSIRGEITDKGNKELERYPELLRKLLYYRGVKTAKDAETFLNPVFEENYDPFLMKGMDRAVQRVFEAVDKNEKVVIFSDYDSDGIPGAVILHDFFKKIGFNNFQNYIPHRVLEGFGLNHEAVDEFAKNGVKLIITVDCGIADIEEAKKIKEHGIDLIITDHHLPKFFSEENLTEALAILDPKQIACKYPDKNLCGAGVAFKLVQALIKKNIEYRIPVVEQKLTTGQVSNVEKNNLTVGWEKWLLDMVGIATISDMVPLIGENRIFAHYGLRVLKKTKRLGLQKLFSLTKIDQKNLTEDDIGFMISPRLNAASRMGKPEDAFNLLIADNETDADKYARHLDSINNERKGVVASLVKEIKKHWKEKDPEKKRRVLVAGNPDWKPSLLGLVASSLQDDHDGPVFLWGREEGKNLKGSCRSDGCVDIVGMMAHAESLFEEFGGHSQSGGFTVSFEKVDLLADGLELAYEKLKISSETKNGIIVDAVISIDDINFDLEKQINVLAPFGVGNPKPIFLLKNTEIKEVRIFGKKNEHLELIFENTKGKRVSAIGFFTNPENYKRKVAIGEKVDLLFNIEKSNFRGRAELRLRIVDIF